MKDLAAFMSGGVGAKLPKLGFLVSCAAALLTLAACGEPEPLIDAAEPSFRRLTEQQYRNIIEDVFGSHIVVVGQFDPILRSEGLIAVGAGETTVSASSIEKFEKLAHSIAGQVVDDRNRATFVPCEPAHEAAPDDGCARLFLAPVGRVLYRGAITEREVKESVDLANRAAEQLGDFYEGLAIALASYLVNPKFLLVVEHIDPTLGNGNSAELTAYAKASRLSFFLWNTAPDTELLDAAERGELDDKRGLEKQVERMFQSRKLRDGVRAFFADMLHFEEFDHLEKDLTVYPAFDQKVIDDAEEQLIRTITYHLLDLDGDYRDLFTTRKTFMSSSLGRIYRVPVTKAGVWNDFEFNGQDSRWGIHNLVGFIALHSHPAISSPTIRGQAVRELLLCQRVPDPPPDVDFSQFSEMGSQPVTARERLAVHNSVASCAGCHRLTDDIGLSLENFDGAGQFRTMDAGIELDITGNLDGVAYTSLEGLGEALKQNPGIPSCLVQRVFSYGTARAAGGGDRAWVSYLIQKFADDGYRFRTLLRSIATSKNFYTVDAPTSAEDSITQTKVETANANEVKS